LVQKFLKEIELREKLESERVEAAAMELTLSGAVRTNVMYAHPKDNFLQKVAEPMTIEQKEKLLGPNSQCTRYPVFKDFKKLWSYNYAAEEKKRFKGLPMWIAPSESVLSDS
jgi:hypothetical protein